MSTKLSNTERLILTLFSMYYNNKEILIILAKIKNRETPYNPCRIHDSIKTIKKKLNTKTITETIRKAKELDLCDYDFGDFDFEEALNKNKYN